MAFVGGAESEVQKWKVPELKSYLQSRGITVSQKRKEELVELVEKARDLSLEPIDDWEKPEDVIVNKLQTKEGSLPCPNTLHSDWTSDFSDFPNFTYGDMYAYLINKEGYDHESLKAYKSFEGYRLFWDGHVLKLMKNKNLFNGYHYVKFVLSSQVRSVWIHLSARDLGSGVCSVLISHSSEKIKSMSLEHAVSCSCDDRPNGSGFSLFLSVLPACLLGAVLVLFCMQLKAPRLLSSGSVRFRRVLDCK